MFLDWFCKEKPLTYGDIQLIKMYTSQEKGANGFYPMHRFGIHVQKDMVGTIDFRDGFDPWLYFGGHIGYRIDPRFRGSHYAYQACMALIPFIQQHHHDTIYITASPENIASRKTIEKLGAFLLDTVDVPSSHWSYRQGERVKCIYQWDIMVKP